MVKIRWAFAAVLAFLPGPSPAQVVVKTENFFVDAPDRGTASRVSRLAERSRRAFALEWLGRDPAAWDVPVFLVVRRDPSADGRGVPVSPNFQYLTVCGPDDAAVDRIVPHEVAHAVMYRELPGGTRAARWLHEGVATGYELERVGYPGRFCGRVGRAPLKYFLGWDDIPDLVDGSDFYGQALSLTLYVKDTWGHDAVFLLHDAVRSRGVEVGVLTALGVTLEDFERSWLDSVGQMGSPYPVWQGEKLK